MAGAARRWIIAIGACSMATACSKPCGCGSGVSGCWIIISSDCRRVAGACESPPPTALICVVNSNAWRPVESEGILKLIVTRGSGPRGYRVSGHEHTTRIATLHALPQGISAAAVRVRLCRTPVSVNAHLAGLKTLNRLDSVLARAEWRNARVWEGLMSDPDGNWVCGTMSNLFVRRGALLATPLLDRCGVAGVMRRWVLENAAGVGLRVEQRRIRSEDLMSAEEIFMSNAVVGIRSVSAH